MLSLLATIGVLFLFIGAALAVIAFHLLVLLFLRHHQKPWYCYWSWTIKDIIEMMRIDPAVKRGLVWGFLITLAGALLLAAGKLLAAS